MIQFSISLLVANLMFISPVLTIGDNLQLNSLEEPSYSSLDRDHKVQIVKSASLFKLLLMKTIGTFNSFKNHAVVTMFFDQQVKIHTEYLPYDKPFFVVKKFQANYLS
jgi:hypothetical protein